MFHDPLNVQGLVSNLIKYNELTSIVVRYRVVPRRVIPSDYIEDLKQRIENLRRAVIQRNEEIAKLRERLIEMSKDRAELLRQKADLDKEKERVAKDRAKFEAVKRERDNIAGKNAELIARIDEYDRKIKDLASQIREYESIISENRNQIDGLEKKISEKDSEISALNVKISQYLESISQLNLHAEEREKALAEKEEIIKDKERRIDEYERRASEVNRYLLEVRDVRIDEKRSLIISKILLGFGVSLAVLGAVFAIFANQLVLSLGMDNLLRLRASVTLLGLSLPVCMVSITHRLFAARLSVRYLNVTGMLTASLAIVLFDLYYPESFIHPFAGTVYLLYVLAVAQHFAAVLLSLPKLHIAGENKQLVDEFLEMNPNNSTKAEPPIENVGEEDKNLFEPIREE
jgi:cation transport ATPase